MFSSWFYILEDISVLLEDLIYLTIGKIYSQWLSVKLKNQSGTSIIEMSLSVVFLFSLIGGFWAMHSLQDMKRNIYSSLYRVFNDLNLKPFTVDSNDQIAPWTQSTVNAGLLDSLNNPLSSNSLTQTASVGSSLFNNATVNCRIVVGYLDVNTSGPNAGKATGTYFLVSDPLVSASTHLADPLITVAASDYASYMTNKKVNAEEARVLLDADTLPQFGGLAGQGPVPIYLQYAPFFVWGCTGQVGLLFDLIPFKSFSMSGIFNIYR